MNVRGEEMRNAIVQRTVYVHIHIKKNEFKCTAKCQMAKRHKLCPLGIIFIPSAFIKCKGIALVVMINNSISISHQLWIIKMCFFFCIINNYRTYELV